MLELMAGDCYLTLIDLLARNGRGHQWWHWERVGYTDHMFSLNDLHVLYLPASICEKEDT